MAVDNYPITVIGVDPGATTGVAEYLVRAKGAELIRTLQLTEPDTVVRDLIAMGKSSKFPVTYVVEQFDNRPGVVSPDFTPKYVINDIRRYMPDSDVVWQTPSQAKNLVKPAHTGKPDGLKRFGWFVVGKRHANDASRHVIVYLVEKLKHKPTILLGWPRG